MSIFTARFRFAILPIFCGLVLASCAGQQALPTRSFEGSITQTIHLQGIGELLQAARDSSKGDSASHRSSKIPNSLQEPNVPTLFGAMASVVKMKIYVREDKVAYEMEALGGLLKIRTIIDRTSRTLTMLLPTHQAMVKNLKAMDTMRTKLDDSLKAHQASIDSLTAAMPAPTGKKETINGLEAEEYRGKVRGMDVDMWLTSDPRMKFYDIVRDAFLGRNHTGTGGVEQLFDIVAPISGGKVPVRVQMSSNGKVLLSSELSDITEEKVDDAMFEIPKDYQIISSDSNEVGAKKEPSPENEPSNDDSKTDTTKVY